MKNLRKALIVAKDFLLGPCMHFKVTKDRATNCQKQLREGNLIEEITNIERQRKVGNCR